MPLGDRIDGGSMRRLYMIVVPLMLLGSPALSRAQVADDTLPERVVARMFDLFDRNELRARSALYDSVYYFQDLEVPKPGRPNRPMAMAPEERARRWSDQSTRVGAVGLPRHREVLQQMVVGRFVVYHIAVLFDPPNEERSFEKLEVYEVKNGKIVAEYDGQFVASGRLVAARR